MDQNDSLSAWVGRSETVSDVLEPARVDAFKAAIGEVGAPATRGEPIPLLSHWLYFWNALPAASLGQDGHPAHGGFLPPVTLSRRMWAGGRITFLKSLLIGDSVDRVSTILNVETKTGRSGTLVFVTVRHELFGSNGPAIVEEQDIVFREASVSGSTQNGEAASPRPAVQWQRDLLPDPILLFRYSALTMNGHRIHYDRAYATDVEGYAGLVVHGPLQATLMIDLAARKLGKPITGFQFRGQAPAFDGTMLNVCGGPTATGASVWTEQGGDTKMIAVITCGDQA